MASVNDTGRGRSSSPRPKPWSAADSDKCECVLEVLSDDVLLGRGSGPNDHVGNIKFRDLVHERKTEYLSTNHRNTKAIIAKDIVDQVYQRGGRFLKKLNAAESAKFLPALLASNGMDDSENDRADYPGPCDVYQIQKHATVMEKAKQALRQNQRNGSPEGGNHNMSPSKGPEPSARRDSLGRTNKISPETPPHGILLSSNGSNNNWNGMGNIPTTLMNGNHNVQRHHAGQYQGNTMRENYEIQNANFSNSPQGRNQDAFQQQQQQLIQQQQDLRHLQQQLYQQRQQHNQQHSHQQQYQSQQLEMETHNQLLQEQLELQIRQEQLRQLQQKSLQKIANNAAMFSDPDHTQIQAAPPAVLNGYATYTTTLDAIEDSRHSERTLGNESDPSKLHDDKSMQLSTMMGSFKDMSVKSGEDHSMHGSTDTIGTIENIPAGLSIPHMSGISMMSMMNDSTDSLLHNSIKQGNDVGANNALWGSGHSRTLGQGPLADVIESINPAAVAAAAVLGKPVPGFDKAQRRWSGGYIPAEVPVQRQRVNRRGSLQFTGNSNNVSNDINQMHNTATAMLAMAQREQEKQEQSFNYLNNSNNGHMNYGAHEMMHPSNEGYQMQSGAFGMNTGYHNS